MRPEVGVGFILKQRRAFSIVEIFAAIAIINILAMILFPLFAQARARARQTSCLSNNKQMALAAMMYSVDYDGTFPRMDNNGSCVYGEPVCAPPDWGDLTLAPGGLNDSYVSFFGVLQPYIKSYEIGICPEIGKSNWAGAVMSVSGVNWGGAYDPAKERFYYSALGHMAVSIYAVDHGSLGASNQARAKGKLAAIARPAETTLFVGESTWDWGPAMAYGVGNAGVWPAMAGSACANNAGDGWTWYIHGGGRGTYAAGSPDRGTKNPNYKGWSNVAFCDGHVKSMKHQQLERCDFHTGQNLWYYPYWETRF